MTRLVDATDGAIRTVNVGGIHHRPGRTQRLRYVFLAPTEEDAAARPGGEGTRGDRAGRAGREAGAAR